MTEQNPGSGGGTFLQPLVHVEQLAPAVRIYETIGATLEHGSRDGDFALMTIGGTQLALLAHPPNPAQNEGLVELNFATSEPLEALETRLAAAGAVIEHSAVETDFGRQLQVRTPDGLLIKINQLDPSRYS